MRDAVIIDAIRTPIAKGKAGGALSSVHPVDLFAHTLRSLVQRTGVDTAIIDDVIGGCVDQVGDQAINTTRWAVLSAGLSPYAQVHCRKSASRQSEGRRDSDICQHRPAGQCTDLSGRQDVPRCR